MYRDLFFFSHKALATLYTSRTTCAPRHPGDHSSGELALIAERASRDLGFRVYAMDAAGFGRSSGTRGLVTSWQHLLDDLHMFVDRVRGSGGPEPMCPAFILGESMGGAMALASSLERPQLWAGMVLLAPMVKISDDAKPPKWQVPLLKAMAFVAPKWAVVPERYDVFDVCYRDLTVRERARADTLRYTGKTRLGTGAALLEASENLEARLADVRTPFVVLHGDADSLTSPAYSQLLYERASASDKAFLTYENAFHCLHSEPDGVGERVLRDIFAWLEQRTSAAALELLYPPVSVADVTPELPADIAGASAAVAAP